MKSFFFSLFLFFNAALAGPSIVGGKTPAANSLLLKSTVSIQSLQEGQYQSFCTGTVIGTRLILTAAHCIAELSVNKLFVAQGLDSNQSKKIEVESFKYFSHHYYQSLHFEENLGEKDIALLRTKNDLALIPVSIGAPHHLSSTSSLISAGYGLEDELQKKVGKLYYLDEGKIAQTSESFIRIEETQNKYVSGGDSGGPLYENDGEKLTVYGILSYSSIESKGQFAVYTAPYFYLSWINTEEQPFLNIKDLAEFNRSQCQLQLPGFSIETGKNGCTPSSELACETLFKATGTLFIWDEESRNCLPFGF